MGKLNLGLDDRSARLIHGRDVWTEIRGLLSGYSAISAAIAFVGPDADQHLPLRGPATIVVNAGDDALASGWTDPQVLLRWTRRGVRVYSLASLHAKVLLAEGHPSFVLIGSADVLSTSGRVLDEAVLVADERETVDELRNAIAGWRRRAGEPLTETWLQAAGSRYHPAAPHRLAVAHAARPRSTGARFRTRTEHDGGLADRTPAVPTAQPAPTMPVQGLPVALDTAAVAAPVTDAAALTVDAGPASDGDDSPPTADDVAAPGGEADVNAEDAPESGPEQVREPQPEDEPDSPSQPGAAAVREPEVLPTAVDPAPAGPPAAAEMVPVDWPRPKYIYLAALTRDGRASDGAQERLEQLRSDFRVPGDRDHPPTLEVDILWWDEPARAAGKSSPTYREGWHVVPISVTGSGRPAVSSQVDSPGRVLSSYTDYSGGPARTYYYLLRHCGGASITFRKLREALTAVGEKPSYNHAYMMQHKVDAILDLWPQIEYSE